MKKQDATRYRRRLATATLASVSVAALMSGVDAAHAADATAQVSEVVVTASRVERTGFNAPTPTTVLGLEYMRQSGATNVADVLNTMPAFRATNTTTTNTLNATAGNNYPDLRGMGPNRTLVLLDGRRHVPTSDANLVDLNVVPTALIQRVEVVTGGASAAWGSDAVAGVVNLILKSEMDGGELQLEGGLSSRGDNEEYKATFAYGGGFADGRGRYIVGGEIFRSEGIMNQRSRSWGAKGFQLIANPLYTPTNGEYARLIAANVHLSNATEGGLIVGGPLAGAQFGPGGVPIAFNYGAYRSSSFMVGGDGINLGLDASIKNPNKRQNILGRVSYDLTPSVTATVEASYAHFAGQNPVVPAFDFGTIRINSDNAFLPASIKAQMSQLGLSSFLMGRSHSDFGYITSRNSTEVGRGLFVLKGDLPTGWSWDAYASYGRTRLAVDLFNNPIVARKALATDAVLDPATGRAVCRSTLTSPTNGCVPLNMFGPEAASQDALNYILGDSLLRTRITQKTAAANLRGEPFSTWAGPVSMAMGAEYRKEEIRATPDALSAANSFLTGNYQPLAGGRSVKEAYVEGVVPLAKDQAWAKALDLNLAARLTDYSTSGRVTTWKAGATYAVNGDFTLRGTWSRDIRAPNLTELFQPGAITFATVLDPVTGRTANIRQIRVGNADLTPELSETRTAGIVFQPSWLPGLQASLDYYKIEVKDAISLLGIQSMIDRCYAGNTALCGFIQRDASGQMTALTRTQVNLAQVTASGFDFEAAYVLPLSHLNSDWDGQIDFRLVGNHVEHLIFDDLITAVDRAGDLSAQAAGVPEWRWTGAASYTRGPFTGFLRVQHISSGKYDSTYKNRDINDNTIPDVTYFDVSAQYRLLERDDGRSVVLFGSVSNLFDKDPPTAPSTFFVPLATNPAIYDVVGRDYRAGVRVRF